MSYLLWRNCICLWTECPPKREVDRAPLERRLEIISSRVEHIGNKNEGTCHDEDVSYFENAAAQRPKAEIDEVYNVTAICPPIREIADTAKAALTP
jgi:hypothetical protein